jgi:hypothetical protein
MLAPPACHVGMRQKELRLWTMRPVIVRQSIGVILWMLAALPAWAQTPAGKAAAADTPLSRCVAGNREKLADWAEALAAANNRHRLNPVVVSRLRTLEADMGGLRNRVPRDSRNLKDCELLSQAIGTEQDRLPRVAGAEPQVAECLAANAQSLREALQGFEALVKAAAGKPAQTAPAEAALARLAELRPLVARESQTMATCRQHTTAIAQERAQLATIAALDSGADAAAMDNCRSANVDGYGELSRAWREAASSRGMKAGNTDFDIAMLRLRKLRDDVARPGFALAECQAVAQAIAQERARVPALLAGSKPASAAAAAASAAKPARPAPPPPLYSTVGEMPVEALQSAPPPRATKPPAAAPAPASGTRTELPPKN